MRPARSRHFEEKNRENIDRFGGVLAHAAHRSGGGASTACAGSWELDPAASSIPQGFPLASETRSYDLRNDGYLVNLVIRKLANGRPDFIQIASKSDGKDYPQYQSGPLAEFQVNGTQTPATYSETVIDDYSVNIIAKVGGRRQDDDDQGRGDRSQRAGDADHVGIQADLGLSSRT
jgi:hypothetical protein